MKLAQRVAVITGAGSGIGRAMALLFASEGARVLAADLNGDAANTTAREIVEAGGEAAAMAVDVVDPAQVRAMVERAHSLFERIDILCNNAGIGSTTDVVECEPEEWDRVMTVNVKSVYLGCKYAIPGMIEQGGGVIVNISSISRAGNVGQTNYSAAKAGVAAMTVTWAKELSRYKIRVAGIAPGFCDTRMVAGIPAKIRERIVSTIPLRRLAEPEEIERTALFILQNDYYNGRVLEIDGGLRL